MTVEELRARLKVVSGHKYHHPALTLTKEEYDVLRRTTTLPQWMAFERAARVEGLNGILIGDLVVYSESSDTWALAFIADRLTAVGK